MTTFFFLFNYSPTTTYACSCVGPNTVEEEFERSAAVFSGKVVDIEDKKSMFNLSSAALIAVKFEVEESWKGLNQKQMTVYTAISTDSCGYDFNLNTAYLVYAYESDGAYNVGLCSRTTPLLTAEKDISELRKVVKPIEQVSHDIGDENRVSLVDSINKNIIYIILLILGLILAATYGLRRHRKNK